MNPILWALAFIGHLGLWCVIYNRTHASSWPRIVRKRCEKVIILAVLLPFFWFLIRGIRLQTFAVSELAPSSFEWFYVFVCIGLGFYFVARWVWRKLRSNPASVLSSSRQTINVQRELGRNIYLTPLANALKRIPFNQSHLIACESYEIRLANLLPELNGLKICQLSDFHFTGQIDLAYFERVVEETNKLQPDLIVITGDLIDEHKCLDWIEPVFGGLNSKYGTFFVRGNHDLRIGDQSLLLQRLEATGMRWVGGKFVAIEIAGTEVSIAGNELPWHAGAENLTTDPDSKSSLKILLTHSPDQIDWATDFDFDMIFAGHCHGGQIALPVIGPIVAPSKYGVLYASGTFEVGDTVMHVSRGLSGDECIRINCPPEIGCFVLRASQEGWQS